MIFFLFSNYIIVQFYGKSFLKSSSGEASWPFGEPTECVRLWDEVRGHCGGPPKEGRGSVQTKPPPQSRLAKRYHQILPW